MDCRHCEEYIENNGPCKGCLNCIHGEAEPWDEPCKACLKDGTCHHKTVSVGESA
jgi:hypothetical protein